MTRQCFRLILAMEGVLFLSVLLLCSIPHCKAIVQGTPDSGNQYSSVCALVATKADGSLTIECSAVLISPTALLTAGHCIGKFQFVTCDWTIEGNPTLLETSAVEPHPLYGEGSDGLRQDLALIKLRTGIMGKPVAPLPPLQVLDDIKDQGGFAGDNAFTIVGYGGTRPSFDPDAKTDEIGNTNKQRQFTPADFNRLSINRIMASLSLQRGSGGSVCSGDSGGAVFYAETGLLAGITIEADSQCMKIANVQRLDVSEARRWLAGQGVNLP